MQLNQAKNVLLGEQQAEAVYHGEELIWSRKYAERMPIMDGITDYFDYRQGLTATGWKNLAGGNDAVWTGMELQSDGSAGVYGTSSSYGEFITPYTGENTLYVVFRTNPIGYVKMNAHIVGSCGGSLGSPVNGFWYGIDVEGYKLADVIGSDQFCMGIDSSVTSAAYHVAALTRTGAVNRLYVDGAYAGSLNNGVAYGSNWGIGLLIDDQGALVQTYEVLRQIKFIAVGSAAHTAEQIAENSAWLREQLLA